MRIDVSFEREAIIASAAGFEGIYGPVMAEPMVDLCGLGDVEAAAVVLESVKKVLGPRQERLLP